MAVDQDGVSEQPPKERIPWQQIAFDDVFLLLMAGLVVPTIFYIVWGLIELSRVQLFQP